VAVVPLNLLGLLLPLFEKTIYNNFANVVASSTSYFIESLRTYKFSATSKGLMHNMGGNLPPEQN
jgi:hypothetical protein